MTSVYIAVGLLGVAIVVAVLVLVESSAGPTGVAKSLALIDYAAGDRSASKIELGAKDRLVGPFLDRTRKLAFALSPADSGARIARMLDRAGNPAPWTPERVMGAKGAALLLGAGLGFAAGSLTFKGLGFALVLGSAGFFVPDLLIYNLALKRQQETSKGLAEALDMLTVCVEAGQGFDGALMQVSRNVEGPISGEFARVLSEIQIGKSRGEAFTGMGSGSPRPRSRTSPRRSSRPTGSGSRSAACCASRRPTRVSSAGRRPRRRRRRSR